MSSFSAEVSRVIDAPPARVYGVLRDYREHHPRILPKPYFESCEVVEGGVGAGTVIRVAMRVMGTRHVFLMTVSEPEPGRVLQEADPAAGTVGTFTLAPVDGGVRTHVTIRTEWRAKPGFTGFMERLVNPPLTRSIFRKELELLSEYARSLE